MGGLSVCLQLCERGESLVHTVRGANRAGRTTSTSEMVVNLMIVPQRSEIKGKKKLLSCRGEFFQNHCKLVTEAS